jgi:thiazole synthase
MSRDVLKIGKYEIMSRLIVGTGKYASFELMKAAHEAAGVDMVTLATARFDLSNRKEKNILDFIDQKKIKILPNTAGAYNVKDAVRIARLAREAGMGDLVKLEVIGDPKTLMPDVVGLIEATRELVQDGFTVMPYTSDDLVVAKKLVEAGAACVMPLAAPIGSGRGIQNKLALKLLMESVECPVIVDAGVGTPSDAAVAMELGADGVLLNTAIAEAKDPVLMASAMKDAVAAGRKAFLAGRMPVRDYASASSPQQGLKI